MDASAFVLSTRSHQRPALRSNNRLLSCMTSDRFGPCQRLMLQWAYENSSFVIILVYRSPPMWNRHACDEIWPVSPARQQRCMLDTRILGDSQQCGREVSGGAPWMLHQGKERCTHCIGHNVYIPLLNCYLHSHVYTRHTLVYSRIVGRCCLTSS